MSVSVTVAAASYSWRTNDMRVAGMQSMRIVMPVDDWNAATLVHPGGQSGQPNHDLYATHYDAFVEGRVLPLWFDEDGYGAHILSTLTLQPK